MFAGHDPYLVALSVVIAILGGYTGFGLTARIRGTPDASHRLLLAGAAFFLAIGIWTMHFVGMLAAPLPAASPGPGLGGVATVNDGSNPFAGRTLSSDGGAAQGALDAAQGADRELLAQVAQNPSAYWLVGGDPGRARADRAGGRG